MSTLAALHGLGKAGHDLLRKLVLRAAEGVDLGLRRARLRQRHLLHLLGLSLAFQAQLLRVRLRLELHARCIAACLQCSRVTSLLHLRMKFVVGTSMACPA